MSAHRTSRTRNTATGTPKAAPVRSKSPANERGALQLKWGIPMFVAGIIAHIIGRSADVELLTLGSVLLFAAGVSCMVAGGYNLKRAEQSPSTAPQTNADRPGVMNLVWGVPMFIFGPPLFLFGRLGDVPLFTVAGLVVFLFGIIGTITGAVQMVRAWLRKPAA